MTRMRFVIRRVAFALLGLLGVCCAANPELRRASDVGALKLQCDAGTAEARLEKDNGTWRVYVVECDLTVVRVACFDGKPCQLEEPEPWRHGRQML